MCSVIFFHFNIYFIYESEVNEKNSVACVLTIMDEFICKYICYVNEAKCSNKKWIFGIYVLTNENIEFFSASVSWRFKLLQLKNCSHPFLINCHNFFSFFFFIHLCFVMYLCLYSSIFCFILKIWSISTWQFPFEFLKWK